MNTQSKPKTARERVLDALADKPEGLSKSRLRDLVGGNAGAFRRLLRSMEDMDEITITEETFSWGPTKMIRAK